MSNRAWFRRRTKGSLMGDRTVSMVMRKLRRMQRSKQPLPLTATSRGHGYKLTITLGPEREPLELADDDLEEQW